MAVTARSGVSVNVHVKGPIEIRARVVKGDGRYYTVVDIDGVTFFCATYDQLIMASDVLKDAAFRLGQDAGQKNTEEWDSDAFVV